MENDINQAPQEYTPEQSSHQALPIKKIISLVIGAVVVVSIIALIVVFVIPRLTGGGSRDVTLTYWGVFEDTQPLEEAAADFHAKNPNIKVTIQKQDPKGLGNYVERLETRIDNGSGPDVFRYHESWIHQLYPYLLPLPAEVVAATELEKKFFPTIQNDLKYNGAYYGVPIQFDSLALFVNTEIFQNGGVTAFPATWDDLITVSRQLTVKDADGKITQSGAALGTYDNIAHASDIISLLMVQNGANLKDLNGSAAKSASDALEFYTSFARGDNKVWDETLANSKSAFAGGKVAMYIGYSWDIFEIKASNPNLKFVIVPVPHLQSRNSTIASYWVEGVSAKTKHPKEAFQFLQFLASRQTMEKLYAAESKLRIFGELYPRSDMAELLKENELVYPFVSQGPDAKSTIFASDTHDDAMIDSLNKYMGDAVRSILNDGTSPESAVEILANGVSQKLSPNEQPEE